MKTVITSAHYICDSCNSETADTNGILPSGWIQKGSPAPSLANPNAIRHVHIGPMCKGSSDPVVIAAIRTLLLGS